MHLERKLFFFGFIRWKNNYFMNFRLFLIELLFSPKLNFFSQTFKETAINFTLEIFQCFKIQKNSLFTLQNFMITQRRTNYIKRAKFNEKMHIFVSTNNEPKVRCNWSCVSDNTADVAMNVSRIHEVWFCIKSTKRKE